MKILCLCQKGNSRSACLAWLLRMKYRHETLAAGMKTCSPETIRMLGDWADVIILVAPQYKRSIPADLVSKMIVWNVGHDTYFKPYDQSLVDQYEQYITAEQILHHSSKNIV